VILVTDGEPNGCNEDMGAIAALAGDANAAEGVTTYAVGLEGSNEAQMNQIAQAGGGEAFFVGSGSAQSELLAALRKIQKNQIACVFALPDSAEAGQEVDPTLVNVNYTPGVGSAQTLGQVPSEGACTESGGWYYDDPADPAIITLCPASCATAQADPDARIEILLGCETEVY
jgi:hypothetical protein